MTKIILKTEPCFSLDESETLLNGSFPAYRVNEFGEEMTNEEIMENSIDVSNDC